MKLVPILLWGLITLPSLLLGQIKSNVTVTEKSVPTEYQPLDPPARKTAIAPTTSVDKTVRNTLGKKLSEVMAKASTVYAYEVESFVNEDPLTPEVLEGFKVLQMELLSKTQTVEIKKLLASESTYFLTEDNKQCLFLPKMGVKFIDGKDTATVLISFKCDMTRFQQSKQKVTLNSDYGHEALVAFFEKVFPTDPFAFKDMAMTVKQTEQPILYTAEMGDAWIIVAQKATNTYKTLITIADICRWNNIDRGKALTNERFLKKGETIIVGFRR